MNRIILLVIMLIGVVAGVAAQDDADAKYASELLKPGVEAPDFTIQTQVPLTTVRRSVRCVVSMWWLISGRRGVRTAVRTSER